MRSGVDRLLDCAEQRGLRGCQKRYASEGSGLVCGPVAGGKSRGATQLRESPAYIVVVSREDINAERLTLEKWSANRGRMIYPDGERRWLQR